MPRPTPTVDEFLQSLDHPMKPEILRLREIVRAAAPELTESVKWNAPNYALNGEDRLTFHLRGRDSVQLIFHRGARAKDAADFAFEDPTGLLQWPARDRAVLKLGAMPDVEAKREALTDLVRRWLAAT
jgi:hypothetical protein